MKKTILLLAIILLAGQVFAQIPEDLDARVAKLVELTLDRTDNKLKGFDRVDVNEYELQVKGNGYTGKINIFLRENKTVYVLVDDRVFENVDTARRYRGDYLTAIEKQGFKYVSNETNSQGTKVIKYNKDIVKNAKDKLNEINSDIAKFNEYTTSIVSLVDIAGSGFPVSSFLYDT